MEYLLECQNCPAKVLNIDDLFIPSDNPLAQAGYWAGPRFCRTRTRKKKKKRHVYGSFFRDFYDHVKPKPRETRKLRITYLHFFFDTNKSIFINY